MVKRLSAGMFRHTVSIQSRTTGVDSYGQQVATSSGWTTDRTDVRAHISTLRGREVEVAKQIYYFASHRVTLEYLSTLDTTAATQKRLLFGDRALQIGFVENSDFEDRHLELICGEER